MLSTFEFKPSIINKITELAIGLGNESPNFTDSDIIPETGLLDSAAIVELIVWIEDYFEIRISDEEMTVENLGSVKSITKFVNAKKQGDI